MPRVERPGRPAEFGIHRGQGDQISSIELVEVPPACPVGHEIQHTLWRPLRLIDRLGRPAGHPPRVRRRAVRSQVGDNELRPVPRHIRVIPLHPRHLCAVRTDTREGVEISTRPDHDRLGRAIGRERHDLVDRLTLGRMPLADTDNRPAVRRQLHVGVAQAGWDLWRGGNRDRIIATISTVKPLVGVITEERDILRDHIRRSAIFVDARAGIRIGRVDVFAVSPGVPADDNVTPTLRRARLEPAEVIAAQGHLAESDRARRNQVGCDR